MKTWNFLQNPFLNATDGNFLKAMGISTFHDSVLAKFMHDAFFATIYGLFHPLFVAYKGLYDSWKAQGGEQQSDTLTVAQLIKLLSTKIGHWDIKIQNQYLPNTAEYKRLLPKKRKPFQRGTQVERIAALNALSQNIGEDTKLTSVKADIDTFYALIDAALKEQKGSIGATKDMSKDLEQARIEMCTAMYSNLGKLIDKYAATPEKIASFFDLEAIREVQQVLFTGQIKAGEVYTIVKHTFSADDELLLSNNGNAPLKFYLAHKKNAMPDGTAYTLAPGDQTVLAGALGKLTDTYLTVQNPEPYLDGEYEVEIL